LDSKVKTARLSILSNTFLIILKIITGILSGSVSILSEAIHSSLDLVAAVMAFYSVKVSGNPPDKRHPYGHGKFENVSGVIEALLIFVASMWIIFEAVNKFGHLRPLNALPAGIAIMLISSVVNIIVSRRLYKVARETDSVALEADALHLKADVWTSAGVGVSLIIIWLSGLTILDPIVAIMVAVFILRESYILLKTAFYPLLDIQLPDEDIEIIKEIIKGILPEINDYHKLRTRKSGFHKFIDLHIVLPQNMSVKESHDICDRIERNIESRIKNSEVTIHVEPK
jgi:cation diffusion facilitator family transporter